MCRVCHWCSAKEAWKMERSATIPWRKTLQMLSSCQGTSGCYKTSQSSRCLTASEAWRPPLCSRSVSDLEISGNLLGRLLSWSLKGVSCICAPSKAIHMETDPQTISAYLIYLSQHAPVEEQASHNDLALVINASCFNYISNTCFFFFQSVLFSCNSADLNLARYRMLPG